MGFDKRIPLVAGLSEAEGIAMLTDKPVLHGDNGATLKATTVLAMLQYLGVKPSYSRPRVRSYARSAPRLVPSIRRYCESQVSVSHEPPGERGRDLVSPVPRGSAM